VEDNKCPIKEKEKEKRKKEIKRRKNSGNDYFIIFYFLMCCWVYMTKSDNTYFYIIFIHYRYETQQDGAIITEIEIDDIDRDIIKLLQDNGRITIAEIAREIEERSENAIRYRIDKLNSEGYISDYTIRLNPKKFGKNIFSIIAIGYFDNNNAITQFVTKKLKNIKMIDYDVITVLNKVKHELYAI
jgi:DNA-binding Lrp family transcriptional regulator